jgi:hypothetical protein
VEAEGEVGNPSRQQGRSDEPRAAEAARLNPIVNDDVACDRSTADVLHSSDISITHLESSCADMQGIATTRLRGAGEGNDVAQIALSAIFSVDRVCTIRAVLKLACD